MVGAIGFDLGILEIFRKHGVSYILKSTNANSITHVIPDKAAKPAFIDELKARYEQVTTMPAAVVCVIGTNIAIPGVLARATTRPRREQDQRDLRLAGLPPDQHAVRDRPGRLQEGGERAQPGALPELAGSEDARSPRASPLSRPLRFEGRGEASVTRSAPGRSSARGPSTT